MAPRAEITRLLALDAGDQRVLSVYLDVPPDRHPQRSDLTTFASLLQALERELPEGNRAALAAEAERVRSVLAGSQPLSRGVVIFSCAALGLFAHWPLAAGVTDMLAFERWPRLRPLLDALDEQGDGIVALVDDRRARLLAVHGGTVEDLWDVVDLVPGHHEQGGWSQANFQRRHEHLVDAHLRNAIRQLTALASRERPERIYLGGPPEALARLRELLPFALRERVAGRLRVELFAPVAEVLAAVREVAAGAERAAESTAVERLLEVAAPGGKAVTGIEATLDAVTQGAVDRLVVAGTVPLAGVECAGCGRLFAGEFEHCPACGVTPSSLGDVIDRAAARVLGQGGTLETVHGTAAEWLLARGGIGAALRFPVGVAVPVAD